MRDPGADIQPMEESGCGTTSSNSSKRLIITEVVLENFKSYAGEQRVGPFHKVCLLYQDQANKMPVRAETCQQHLGTRVLKRERSGSVSNLFLTGIVGNTAVLLISGGAQWERQVQRHRCHALRLWQEG